jgi:hypothetical protein
MTRKLSLQNKKSCKGEGKGQRRTVIVLFGPLRLHRLGRLIDCILIEVAAELLKPVLKQQKEQSLWKHTMVSWIKMYGASTLSDSKLQIRNFEQ